MSKSSSDPITRRASSSCPSDGSSSARPRGLEDAGAWPRIGKISTAEASHSYVSRRSGSCSESYAIQHDLSGQTLSCWRRGIRTRSVPCAPRAAVTGAVAAEAVVHAQGDHIHVLGDPIVEKIDKARIGSGERIVGIAHPQVVV